MSRMWSAIGVIVVLCSGCRTVHPPLDPTRSYFDLGTGKVQRVERASLIVHTPTRLSHQDDVARYLHTGYHVYDSAGQWLQFVPNHMSFSDERPTPVELTPGRYLIRLEYGDGAARIYWVTVRSGIVTEVDPTAPPPA